MLTSPIEVVHSRQLAVRADSSSFPEKLGLAFEAAIIGMAFTTLDGTCLHVNQALCNLLGRSEDDLLGSKWLNLPDVDETADLTAKAAAIVMGRNSSFRHVVRRAAARGGRANRLSLTVSTVADRERALGLLVQVEDLTRPTVQDAERRRASVVAKQREIDAELDLRSLLQRQRAVVCDFFRSVLAGPGVDVLFRIVARSARELAASSLATISVRDDESGSLIVSVADGAFADRFEGRRVELEPSVGVELLSEDRLVLVEDAVVGPPISDRQDPNASATGPALYVPLASRNEVFGVLAVSRTGGRPFSETDVAMVGYLAAQAGVAFDSEPLTARREHLAVVEDRERIAKELHDGVVQSLFAVGMLLQGTIPATVSEAVLERIGKAIDGIDDVIRSLRHYILGLRPQLLTGSDVERALLDLADRFSKGGATTIRSEIDPKAASLVSVVAPDVLQAAREALSNAVRHSGSNEVTLRLGWTQRCVALEVEDEGKGFDPRAVTPGHGLANLRARADALGAQFDVRSGPGRGTRVRIRMKPIPARPE